MKLHEFQAKALLREVGVAVPPGEVAASPDEAREVARTLGGGRWVVKAQVHAGGRGKAGGVRLCEDLDAVVEAAETMLAKPLVTVQTGPEGQPVHQVLVEGGVAVAREFYLGLLVDRARERLVVVASPAGGMDIEEVAARHPEQLHTVAADPVAGLQPFHCRQLGFALGLEAAQLRPFGQLLQRLYDLYWQRDLSLVEINPLVLTEAGDFMAVDAKITVDDNALYRQGALEALRDETQEDPREVEARHHALNFVALDGDIGCMVNGAGLAMATMDLIKLHGGAPANFLDVGGGTSAERVAAAFRLLVSSPQVKAILVNIFGGIVRCDLIAEGIVTAAREVALDRPLVVRLEGTRVEEGRAILAESGLPIISAEGLTDAARKVVAAAQGRR